MIIIRKKIAAAASYTYELEMDWTVTGDQSYTDAQTLDTSTEGLISGMDVLTSELDGSLAVSSGVLAVTGQTTPAADALALWGQSSLAPSMGATMIVTTSGTPGYFIAGWANLQNSRAYSFGTMVWWLEGTDDYIQCNIITNLPNRAYTGSSELVLVYGGFNSSGDVFISGDTASNFKYGARVYVRDDTRTSFRLVAMSAAYGADSTAWPSIDFQDDNMSVLKWKYLQESSYKVSESLMTPECASRWSGTAGDLISSEYTPDVGGNWDTDNFDLVSGGCHCNSAGDSCVSYSANGICWTSVTTPASGTTAFGYVMRKVDSSNYWYLKFTPGSPYTVELIEVTSGSPTTRGSVTPTLSASTSYLVAFLCDENNMKRVNVNGQTINYLTTNTAHSSGTDWGIKDEGTSNAIFGKYYLFDSENPTLETEFNSLT